METRLEKADIKDFENIMEISKTVESKTFHSSKKEDIIQRIDEGKFFFVVFKDLRVGIISYQAMPDSISIFDVAILPQYQDQGIGTHTIQKIIDVVGDDKKIELVVHPENNKAIHIYEKFGFKITKRVENYFSDNEPRVIMVKYLV